MRLYRGLKEPYRPSHALPQSAMHGADFTDCPYVAMQYASTRRRESCWFSTSAMIGQAFT